MKKLLVLLLISILAIFVFAGCEGLVPSEGEGEGEGEGEPEVVVEIDGMVQLAGKNWIACGNHDITVTFPAPVENATAYISDCSGDYSKDKQPYGSEGNVVLFPNEDKTVWTGSGCFPTDVQNECNEDCCAAYVEIYSGECAADTCIVFPVIIDCDDPYACIDVTVDECVCDGCEITFKSTDESQVCADNEACCGDDCSGIAGWSIALFDEEPFEECCENPCAEPIYTCSGTTCPIECTTGCLTAGDYWAVINLVDNVGNETEYYGMIVLTEGDGSCGITVTQYLATCDADHLYCECTDWNTPANDTSCDIGFCGQWNNCDTTPCPPVQP